MSASLSSALSNLPYISFLSTYPHPAFILAARKRAGAGIDADTQDLEASFLKALTTVDQAQRFAFWVEHAHLGQQTRDETLVVEIRPTWIPEDAPPVLLELTHTLLDDFLVCTSVPRSTMPRFGPTPAVVTNANRTRKENMRLPDFPPSGSPLVSTGGATPTAQSTSMRGLNFSNARQAHSAERGLEVQEASVTMRERIENYDWHLTPVGPRSSWPTSLRTAINITLDNPFPQAIWWGQELVLMYNDAYADMAGSKHPFIFAQRGSDSWGELWEQIGPLARKVLGGEAVAKSDDLLFFNRLTDANLPEECYHTWNWIPITQEDGTVGGMINGTFETTQKVVTERRLDVLRDIGNTAGVARTRPAFANAILNVLDAHTLDVPFAAFYFASSDDIGARDYSQRPRTSYINQPLDDSLIRIRMRLAGTVGIRTPHPSTPETCEVLLDPETLTSRSPPKYPYSDPPLSPSVSPLSSSLDLPTGSSSVNEPSPIIRTEGKSTVSENASTPSTSSGTTSGTIVPDTSEAKVIWPFAEAFSTRRAVHVQNIADYVVDGFDIRGWGEHAREAVAIPIAADDSPLPGAVLILGLNSRRPYDDDYASWIDLTRVSLNALLTAVKGREADAIRVEQLSQLDDAKTSFFSNASHELRTPLTLIAGPLQDSISSVADTNVKDNLKLAARNVSRLSRLVDSLMDFSKIAANKLEGRFKPVQLGAFTADLASLFKSVIEKSNIEYKVACDSNERKLCFIDPDFWEKIVFNLIGNAFKYTLGGFIDVSLEYDADHAHFRVRDTGVGIPHEDIDKIFDRFHRVDSVCRSYEGTGIGLALTKELVKLHGGTLKVSSTTETESPDEHGSTFTVSIPLGKDHLPPFNIVHFAEEMPHSRSYARGIVDEATHWSSRPNEERTPSESSDSGSSNDNRIDTSTLFFLKSDIILLVDDSADMRHYVRSLFIPYCKVVEASNGKEALKLLDSFKPSLILCDVMMPVMDGYGLVDGVRRRADTKLIPIILLTAQEGDESRVEGLLSGADDYLGKPFNSRELIARVHLQMQLGKRRAELEARFLERTREIHLLSDLSPVGIFRADTEGHLLYVNPRWWEISGHDRSAPIDTWSESVMPRDVAKVTQAWYTAVHLNKSASLEFRFKNGSYTKGQFEPLMTDAGDCTGVIGTITDVSDQRLYEAARLAHAQEREASARKRAEEAEERRKEADERRRGQELLIDVTSHELRQPVSAILNCSSLVRSNLALLQEDLWRCHKANVPFSPSSTLLQGMGEDLDALDAIYQCGLAQERIANDVLSLSRIQLQVLSINPVEFELTAEMKKIVSIFRNEVKMKRINLDLRFGHSLRKLGVSSVRSDKSRFGQVITNLLSNGIKFTDTSTDKRDIIVTTEVSRHAPAEDGPCVPPHDYDETPMDPQGGTPIFVYVSVQDSGPGLQPEDLTLLFKRFQQGSNSHNVFGGSGLGLFVSRKLCDLMGGRIDVDSVYGQGATFRFFIEATTAPVQLQNGQAENSTSSPSPHHLDKSPHILITEDNLINQTILNRQLKKAGCITELASNGSQAVDRLRAIAQANANEGGVVKRPFDVILMDCEMPVMDGLTATREIRRMEAVGELPWKTRIIALTGNARAGQIQSAREAGMDDVIIKPYKLDELLIILQGSSNL